VNASAGATRLGAEKLPDIVTRGVLLDLPRLRGVDGLDEVSPGYPITGDDLDEAVEAAGVTFSEVAGRKLMRPPYGRRRPGTLRVLKEKGYIGITWSITGYDWRPHTTAEAITRRCLKAGEGDIILLHDGFDQHPAIDRHRSVETTKNLLEHYRPQGYEFVTVPQLVDTAGTESRYAA